MAHSILPPSSAGIWGKPDGCTGWVLMNQTYPETEESPESAEGTASHEIGAELIAQYARGRYAATADDWVGKVAPNGVVFTDAMFEGAQLYAEDVLAEMRKRSNFNPRIEQRVDIPGVHALNWGTPDCSLYDKPNNELVMWDYKFGFGVVEAFENWQGINYTAGLLDLLEIDGYLDQHTTVRIRIVQPRAHHRDGPIREWVILAADLRAHINILAANAEEALGPNAKFNTGSHCKNCPGRHACPAALKAGVRLFEAATAALPVELTPEAAAVQLSIVTRARKQLECLEEGLTEQIKALIRSGAPVPGYAAEPSVGREKWDKPVAEVLALGDMLGHNLRKPDDAITPNQARKLGIDAAVISAYSIKPNTGVKLVPDNGSKAKQVFSK